jgi:hypothetical protein
MAKHDVSFEIPQKFVLSKNVVFEIKSNNSKLGSLLISKGNIEWVPANNSVKKRRLSWERFAILMETEGKEARIKQQTLAMTSVGNDLIVAIGAQARAVALV